MQKNLTKPPLVSLSDLDGRKNSHNKETTINSIPDINQPAIDKITQGPAKSIKTTNPSTSTEKAQKNKAIPSQGSFKQNPQIVLQGGGKLNQNKKQVAAEGNNRTGSDFTTDQKIERTREKIYSPLQTFKNQFFMYNKIQANNMEKADQTKLSETFLLLTSSKEQRKKDIQQFMKADKRAKKIEIDYLRNSTSSQQNQSTFYFSLVIHQLMIENPYLSFKGSLRLVNQYLRINKQIYYPKANFNLDYIKEKSNLKILNEIMSNNIRNEEFFKKIVRDISFLKDLVFIQYTNFFKLLWLFYDENEETELKSKKIISDDFLSNFVKFLWISFKNILDSQKKQITNYCELNIILKGIHIGMLLNPRSFDQKQVEKDIIEYLKTNNNIKLLQSSNNLQIELLDNFVLHVLLVFPFVKSKWNTPFIKMIQPLCIERYDYLTILIHPQSQNQFFANNYPLKSSGTVLFIEKLIQKIDFSKISPEKDHFLFFSIYNILAYNQDKFWKEPTQYKNIRQYIFYLQSQIQQFSSDLQSLEDNSDKQFNAYHLKYYVSVCKFAKLISLLCLPVTSDSPKQDKYQQLVKNRYIINDLLKIIFRIIRFKMDDMSKLQEGLQRYLLNTQVLYQFLFKMIIYNSTQFINKKQDYLGKETKEKAFECALFGDYLQKYSLNGDKNHICILAFTKLIQDGHTKIAKNLFNYFNQLDKSVCQYIMNNSKHQRSWLHFILTNLFQFPKNYIPLAKNILCIIKYMPQYYETSWTDKLTALFREVPERFNPENISQYATILDVTLKFIQRNPDSYSQLQQVFDFQFANKFLSHVLVISHESKIVLNKFMRGKVYEPVSVAVKLLKMMTQTYLFERQHNTKEIIPYNLRRLLECPNKDGSYQIVVKNMAVSYHLALTTILLSRQINIDSCLNDTHPDLKNDILQTLINLNHINFHLKQQPNLKIYFHEDRELQIINKNINFKSELYDYIIQNPSYLGFQYLISSGSLDIKHKIQLLEKVKAVTVGKSLSNMRQKAHFLQIYWKEAQNQKLKRNLNSVWEFMKIQISEILGFLTNFQRNNDLMKLNLDDKNLIDEIFKSLYLLSDRIRSSSKEIFTQFILKFHQIHFNLSFNNQFSQQNQRQTNASVIYHLTLLNIFNCKYLLSNQLFRKLINQQQMHEHLFIFVNDLLKVTYQRHYNKYYDLKILQLIQYGLLFLVQLCQQEKNQEKLRNWLDDILNLFEGRPGRSAALQKQEIVILMLLYSQLKRQVSSESIEFSNTYWLLLMNSVKQNHSLSHILLKDLIQIYDRKHPIFFSSSCRYLAQTAKTKIIEGFLNPNKNQGIIDILLLILKKSIQSQKSYYSIWIVQILTEIFMNKSISSKARNHFCKQIRYKVLSSTYIHERISEILTLIGSFYSKDFINLWRPHENELRYNNQRKFALFSQQQQLLSYLRLLTLIYFMDKNQKKNLELAKQEKSRCEQVENHILHSCLDLIPMLEKVLKDDTAKNQLTSDCQEEWEKKVRRFELSKISEHADKSRGSSQNANSNDFWKGKTGLDLLSQVTKIQLCSIVSMWASTLIRTQFTFGQGAEDFRINNFIFGDAQNTQRYQQILYKFIDVVKHKLLIFKKNQNQIQGVIKMFNKTVYEGSIQISQELLFTNMKCMSSNLNLDLTSMIQRLRETFFNIYSLLKYSLDGLKNSKCKIDPRILKMDDHLHCQRTQFRDVEAIINFPGTIFEFKKDPTYRSNFSLSMTKSRTIKTYK